MSPQTGWAAQGYYYLKIAAHLESLNRSQQRPLYLLDFILFLNYFTLAR
jgi:hypothetical protein